MMPALQEARCAATRDPMLCGGFFDRLPDKARKSGNKIERSTVNCYNVVD